MATIWLQGLSLRSTLLFFKETTNYQVECFISLASTALMVGWWRKRRKRSKWDPVTGGTWYQSAWPERYARGTPKTMPCLKSTWEQNLEGVCIGIATTKERIPVKDKKPEQVFCSFKHDKLKTDWSQRGLANLMPAFSSYSGWYRSLPTRTIIVNLILLLIIKDLGNMP